MATLAKRKDGSFEVQFYFNGARRYITLGAKRFSEETAVELKKITETLLYYKSNGVTVPDKKVLVWIQSAAPEIRDKLMKVNLIVTPKRTTLDELWKSFLRQKTSIKDSTRETYNHAERRFFLFFDGGQDVSELTPTKMEQWRDFLLTQVPREASKVRGLERTTVVGTLAKAKAVCNWAVRTGLIGQSPLSGIGAGSYVNKEKDRHITPDEYQRLLDSCPCQDWRTIIALARIGGLRCPSELLRLRWSDVNWDRNRFYVRSPKTEHHEGKGGRVVPLFPGLRVELERLFEMESSIGQEFVITRYRDPERTNLGTQFGRIVQLAGVDPIEKPFTNMRASRSTEVYAEFGAFLESKWIGHSPRIAKDHYLQVREVDFELAVGGGLGRKPASGWENGNPSCVIEESQRSGKSLPAKSPAAGDRNRTHGTDADKKKEAVNP